MAKSVVVAAHGHCFDGLCSSTIFTELLSRESPPDALAFTYRACGYGPGENGVDVLLLTGEENAILDYRFTNTDKLTFYYDHHASAFVSPEDRAAFDSMREKKPNRMVFDPKYGSCTKLIFDTAKARGVDMSELAELVRWADIIDSAKFPNAEMAVLRKEPALQLMSVVENHGDEKFYAELVPLLRTRPLEEIALSEKIQTLFTPIRASIASFTELVKANAVERDGVVLVDLTAGELESAPKFVTYALYPESRYSIVVTRSKKRSRLSIGYNPWSKLPRTHEINKICERHGGGGHAVVGAIALGANEVDKAKELAKEIANELSH